MSRLNDWPEKLAAFIEARRHVPFQWGVVDCCLLAADAVLAMTGDDPAADVRGRYKSARGAKRVMADRSVADLAAERLGEEVPVLLAQRGDVVLFEGGEGLTLGVCVGQEMVAPGPNGLVAAPMSKGLRAWRV